MARIVLLAGTVSGFLSIILKSMSAHAFNEMLTSELLTTLKTAIDFQLIHSMVLILIALLIMQKPHIKAFSLAGWAIFIGILSFSGSLYIRVFADIGSFGLLTPTGGLAILFGWACLIVGAWNLNDGISYDR